MRCYLPFPGCTAGFCLRSYLAPHLRLSRKSWAAFSCHFACRGEGKKKKEKLKQDRHVNTERGRCGVNSYFFPEIRKSER